jgi:hypothetical protein
MTAATPTAYDRLLSVLADDHGLEVVEGDDGLTAMAQCPAHNDGVPSLSLRKIKGSVLYHCHAGCEPGDVLKAIEWSSRDLYDKGKQTYTYDSGRQVIRSYDADGKKRFAQRNTKTNVPELFRKSKVEDATELGLAVYFVEGEKDVLALESLGVVATTAPQGAKNVGKVDFAPLAGATVVCVRDADDAGRVWVRQVAAGLTAAGARFVIVTAKAGKDAADHIAAGFGVEDFEPYEPDPEDVAPEFEFTYDPEALYWLKDEIGRHELSGMFLRGKSLVHTPMIGEAGYKPLQSKPGPHDDDGPAQVREVSPNILAGRVDLRYRVSRDYKPTLFPEWVAKRVLGMLDAAPNVRGLRSVTHTPILAADGTVIQKPGYHEASETLYLPVEGMERVTVPDEPTWKEVAGARDLVLHMLADFPWNSDHDRANYLTMLLTPILREICPPPYKLGLIGAHQAGSGKSFLAWILRELFGGVFRGNFPKDDAELGKQITSILLNSTGSVIQFDNVRFIGGEKLDALLTTPVWSDRILGATKESPTLPNDRLWIATGNNVAHGGDLWRRVLNAQIDPDVENPQDRTDFQIPNLKQWVREHKIELLSALLTLARAWVVAGRPLGGDYGSDDFRVWLGSAQGILDLAKIPGTVDHADTKLEKDDESNEWLTFLVAAYEVFKDKRWTSAEMSVECVNNVALRNAMPEDMKDTARSIGNWCKNRNKQWSGGYVVRSAGKDNNGLVEWRLERSESA